MKKLLFICTGNTCRSSMAEELARKAAEESGLASWQFISAGIYAVPGSPASANAHKVMADYGRDLGGHQARQVSEELIRSADLVLTMTCGHRDKLNELYPWAKEKVFTLLKFSSGEERDIGDPFGGNQEIYRRSAGQIEAAVNCVISKLSENNNTGC